MIIKLPVPRQAMASRRRWCPWYRSQLQSKPEKCSPRRSDLRRWRRWPRRTCRLRWPQGWWCGEPEALRWGPPLAGAWRRRLPKWRLEAVGRRRCSSRRRFRILDWPMIKDLQASYFKFLSDCETKKTLLPVFALRNVRDAKRPLISTETKEQGVDMPNKNLNNLVVSRCQLELSFFWCHFLKCNRSRNKVF